VAVPPPVPTPRAYMTSAIEGSGDGEVVIIDDDGGDDDVDDDEIDDGPGAWSARRPARTGALMRPGSAKPRRPGVAPPTSGPSRPGGAGEAAAAVRGSSAGGAGSSGSGSGGGEFSLQGSRFNRRPVWSANSALRRGRSVQGSGSSPEIHHATQGRRLSDA
jgi:hypothetical protein